MKFHIIITTICVALFLTTPVLSNNKKPQEELINGGISLYDAGDYPGAVKKYQEALIQNPANTEALYELAMTYTAMKEYENCIKAAEKGLKLHGKEQSILYAVLASCYSYSNQTDKALKIFKAGLVQYPDDISLNFNISITLVNTGNAKEAKPHLKHILELQPLHTSATFVLAKVFEIEGNKIPAILTYSRYLMLDPSSARTASSAQAIIQLMKLGVEHHGDKDTNITLNMDAPKDEGDFGSIELFLSLAVAEAYGKEESKNTELQRQSKALFSFFKFLEESKEQFMMASFVWKHSAEHLFKLVEAGHMEAFTYYLLANVGTEGAVEWMKNNDEKMEALGTWMQKQ